MREPGSRPGDGKARARAAILRHGIAPLSHRIIASEGINPNKRTPGGVAVLPHPFRRVVEHVYLTYEGGTPLVHLSRTPTSDKDPDLIASMFTAVQSFMDDSFHSLGIGNVRSIELGDRHHVAFGRGHHVLLYVVYRGRESNRLEDRVIRHVHAIEVRFAQMLQDWNGDMDRVAGLRDQVVREWELPARETPAAPSAAEIPAE